MAELGLFTLALLVQPRFRIGRAGMRGVGALLAVEIHFRVAALEAVGVVGAVRILLLGLLLGHEALDGSVRLDQGAVDAEVVLRGLVLPEGPSDGAGEERGRNAQGIESWPVVREDRGVKSVGGRVHVQKPAEQQVGIDAFNQLAFRADGVECLQQHGLEHPFGGHTGPADIRIGLIEQVPHVGQIVVDELLDRPQRMIRANPILHVQGVKHVGLTILLSTHGGLRA